MCGCRTWIVTYPPDEQHPQGRTEVKRSATAARIAAAKVAGATWKAEPT
jgi:hypothetical protein